MTSDLCKVDGQCLGTYCSLEYTLCVSRLSAGVPSCLTGNACQQGKPAGFTLGTHGCIQEPVARILIKFKT